MESSQPAGAQSFGEALQAWRKLRGLQQKQLADLVGVHQGTISRLEANDTGASVALLVKIGDALGLDPEDVATLLRLAAVRPEKSGQAA